MITHISKIITIIMTSIIITHKTIEWIIINRTINRIIKLIIQLILQLILVVLIPLAEH